MFDQGNFFQFSFTETGKINKKIFMVNKNIVHLIDDVFWNMGFKTESQADKVYSLHSLYSLFLIIHIMFIIYIILIIFIIFRFVRNWVLQITCGRTKGQLLLSQLMP